MDRFRAIAENRARVLDVMAEAAARGGRAADAARLVAVVKKRAAEDVRMLLAAGQKLLAENHPQRLWERAEVLDSASGAVWHLIGHLQTNKVARTLPVAELIHGVDTLDLLLKIEACAVRADPAGPKVCLQVNTSGEPAKHGWSPEGIVAEAEAIAAVAQSSVKIVGLMTMGPLQGGVVEARRCFVRLRGIRDELSARTGLPLPELSMGMSGDFEAAVKEGATLVRVGSALFEGVDP